MNPFCIILISLLLFMGAVLIVVGLVAVFKIKRSEGGEVTFNKIIALKSPSSGLIMIFFGVVLLIMAGVFYDKLKTNVALTHENIALNASIAKLENSKIAINDAFGQTVIAYIDETKSNLEETEALLEKAPKGKGTTIDIEVFKADLMNLEASLPEFQLVVNNKDYLGAYNKAKSLREEAKSLSDKIKVLLEKIEK